MWKQTALAFAAALWGSSALAFDCDRPGSPIKCVHPPGAESYAEAAPPGAQFDDRITLLKGFAAVPYEVGARFKSVRIGDESIVDIITKDKNTIESDTSVELFPKKEGLTNILFLDDRGKVIRNLFVSVDATESPLGAGYMHMHNQSKLSGFTAYRCDRSSCKWVGENIVDSQKRETENVTRTFIYNVNPPRY